MAGFSVLSKYSSQRAKSALEIERQKLATQLESLNAELQTPEVVAILEKFQKKEALEAELREFDYAIQEVSNASPPKSSGGGCSG